MRKFLQKYLLIIAAVVVIIFLLQRINWLPSFKNIFKSQPVVIEKTPIIIQQINALAQLVTVTYTDEVVMDTLKIGNGMPSLLPINIGTVLTPAMDRLVIIGRGKVLAGTDLKNLKDNDIKVVGDSVNVLLPHSAILQTIVNPSDFETFDEQGDWNEGAVTALKIKIRNQINDHALQQGILHQADSRCKNIIETFLRNTGFNKVDITFKN